MAPAMIRLAMGDEVAEQCRTFVRMRLGRQADGWLGATMNGTEIGEPSKASATISK